MKSNHRRDPAPAERMTELAERLQAIVWCADPEGLLTFRVSWLAALLSQESCSPGTGDRVGVTVDLTVADVAELFGRSESTVRTCLGSAEFPNAYKLQGRDG